MKPDYAPPPPSPPPPPHRKVRIISYPNKCPQKISIPKEFICLKNQKNEIQNIEHRLKRPYLHSVANSEFPKWQTMFHLQKKEGPSFKI